MHTKDQMHSQDDFSKSLAVIVLSPDHNIARLGDTTRSARMAFGDDVKVLCCTESAIKKEPLDEMCGVCPSYRAGGTVTSLINGGFRHAKGEGWRLFVMEGARFPKSLAGRYGRWVESDRDVLFPVSINHDRSGRPLKVLSSFEECSLNGMLIHSRLFRDAGSFSDNPIMVSKSFWAMGAMQFGARFKGILGAQII
jgi:hypothetical protein